MKVSAVIFDLDGTVLDNEDEYGNAFARVLRDLSKNPDSKYPQIGGIGVRENWPILLEKYKVSTKLKVEELAKKTQSYYLEELETVTVKEGFYDFIGDLRDSGILTALATSNDWWIVEKLFEKLDLQRYFDTITTGEEVSYKKPDPDIFLLTADKLGVPSEECLVIEDAKAGIAAAHEAGMRVVAIVRDEEHRRSLEDADFIIESFKDISPRLISSL